MSKQKGFSLIELLIVVAIILIIAAIAIPNMVSARIAANEASAVESLRTITTAEASYASTYGTGYAKSLATLASSGLIDDTLGSGSKSGYSFNAAPGSGNGTSTDPFVTFTSNATRLFPNTGRRAFCTDSSGVIRYTTSTLPFACNTTTSAPIQ